PSGSLIPSHADIEVTKRLDKVGDLVGIQVLDHIIVSANDSLSMRKGMYF
ncbi:MAG: JAB domain-containing protein, partial [Finegoldia magna]|nr:JAB domain-containing protein [Finegoldia magna]